MKWFMVNKKTAIRIENVVLLEEEYDKKTRKNVVKITVEIGGKKETFYTKRKLLEIQIAMSNRGYVFI